MGTTLPIQAITRDRLCQPRACLTPDVIEQYAEAMQAGATFPPITVFHDGQTHHLADGFHRVAAAEQAGVDVITCDIRQGGIRDAMLYSVGANATHGLRRLNVDKWQAVETLIEDPEWSQWSDREIARRCVVSHTFVQNFKNTLATVASEREAAEAATVKYTTKHGTVATMNTENIGRRPVALIDDDVDQDTGEIVAERRRRASTSNEERARMVAIGLVRANGNTFARNVANAILEITGA